MLALKKPDFAALLLIFAAACYAWFKPIWDWDFMAYLFLAKQVMGVDFITAHRWLYGDVVPQFPEAQQHLLLYWERFRTMMAADPEALRQVGAFYHERVGFYGFLALLMTAGVPPIAALKGTFVLNVALLGHTVWTWLQRVYRPVTALAVLAAILVFPTVMKVVRWSSPDGLVAATYVLGLYCFLHGKRGMWLAAWLVMVSLKPNSAMLVAPLGVLLLCEKAWRDALALLLIGGVAAFLHQVFPAYGLAFLWQHSWGAGPFAYPAAVAAQANYSLTFDAWWQVWSLRMGNLHGRDLLIFNVMFLCLFILLWKAPYRIKWLGLALVAGVMGQVVAYPGFWERLYMGPVLGIFLLTLENWAISVKTKLKIINQGA